MAVQVNNPNLHKDFITIFGNDNIALQTHLHMSNTVQEMTSMHGPISIVTGIPRVELYVEIYLDQASSMLEREFNYHKVEQCLSTAIQVMDGRFMSRYVEPFRDGNPCKLTYTVILPDVEQSLEKLHQYALTRVDQEFIAALEAKLLET